METNKQVTLPLDLAQALYNVLLKPITYDDHPGYVVNVNFAAELRNALYDQIK